MEIWKLINIAFYLWIGTESITIKQMVLFLLGGTSLGDYPVGFFWFLNALIGVYLVFPIIQYLFDAVSPFFTRWLFLVLLFFTILLPTAKFLLLLFGGLTKHNISDVLDPLGSFSVFGGYAYVLVYFMLGGYIARYANTSKGRYFITSRKGRLSLLSGVIICWILLDGMLYFQQKFANTEYAKFDFSVILPMLTIVALLLLLCIPLHLPKACTKIVIFFGSNTFGVYMLHFPVYFLLSKLGSGSGVFALPVGRGSSCRLMVEDVFLALAIYFLCAVVTWACRKIPIIGRIFSFK